MKAEIKPRIDFEGRTKLEEVIPLSTPYLVFLDPSDICNAKCSWCPTGSGEAKKYRKPQLMDFDLYKKIIDDLCTMPESIKTLRLYMMGEPLLNPRFIDMVRYAKSTERFGQVDTTTNGKLLGFNMNWDLTTSGLDKIFISVPHDYKDWYAVNVSQLYAMQAGGKLKIYVKIIGDHLSDKAKDKFMEDFGNIADRIFVEYLSPCWPGFDVQGVNKEKGIYGQPIKPVNICPYIFYSLSINSDGTVSLCYLDWRHDMIIGDLKEESFKDIWNGTLLRNIRMDHLRGYRMKVTSNCANCGQLSCGAADVIDPSKVKL
ncbi:radical SAM protein [bacterium]|nr:MAG: radical SAM protein [bacterium]